LNAYGIDAEQNQLGLSGVEQLSAFRDWAERYMAGAEARRAALIDEGVALAQARRRAMAELIRADPASALEWVVPVAIRRKLPRQVEQLLEHRVAGCGDLSVVASLSTPGEPMAGSLRRFVQMEEQ